MNSKIYYKMDIEGYWAEILTLVHTRHCIYSWTVVLVCYRVPIWQPCGTAFGIMMVEVTFEFQLELQASFVSKQRGQSHDQLLIYCMQIQGIMPCMHTWSTKYNFRTKGVKCDLRPPNRAQNQKSHCNYTSVYRSGPAPFYKHCMLELAPRATARRNLLWWWVAFRKAGLVGWWYWRGAEKAIPVPENHQRAFQAAGQPYGTDAASTNA